MHWKKRHKLRKIVANHANRKLRRKPYLYNEYVKKVCKYPKYMKSERPLPIVSHRSLKRYRRKVKEATDRMLGINVNTAKSPRTSKIEQEYIELFAKLRLKRKLKIMGEETT